MEHSRNIKGEFERLLDIPQSEINYTVHIGPGQAVGFFPENEETIRAMKGFSKNPDYLMLVGKLETIQRDLEDSEDLNPYLR
jgi:hypothetical protein